MASQSNTIFALLPQGAKILTLDIAIEMPAARGTGTDSVTPSTWTFQKNMNRMTSETADKTLERLRMLLVPPTTAKPAKGQKTSRESILEGCPTIQVQFKKAAVNGAVNEQDLLKLTNDAFWKCVETLTVHLPSSVPSSLPTAAASTAALPEEEKGVVVRVHYNIPTVVSVTPPIALFAGVPAMCSGIKVLFAANEQLRQQWYLNPVQERSSSGSSGPAERELVSELPVFVPSAAMIGRTVTYRCAAVDADGNLGMWTELDLPAVRAFGDMQPRWQHIHAKPHASAIRVCSYNVLHSDFASTNHAKRVLYPFAKPEVLDLSYRQSRIAMELGAMQSDIVCLQECGQDVYQKFYQHILQHHRMDSRYVNKSGQVREGCLTAFSTERFELLSHESTKLSWSTFVEAHPALAEQLAPYKHLVEALQCITSIATATVLRDRLVPDRIVIVGNTHFFYHANGCHIRILQAYAFSHFIDKIKQQVVASLSQAASSPVISLVLCGDFNMTRRTGGYRLLQGGQVEREDISWPKGLLFWWTVGKNVNAVVGYREDDPSTHQANPAMPESATITAADLEEEEGASPQLAKPTAAGLTTAADVSSVNDAESEVDATKRYLDGPPLKAYSGTLVSPLGPLVDTHAQDSSLKFTCYGLTFKAIIDHIFTDATTLEVLGTVPAPPESELAAEIGIPSTQFPSDHIPLVVDLAYVRP